MTEPVMVTGRFRAEVGVTFRAAHVNGQPGVMSVEVANGLVQTIRGITNPDKLEHLGPVLDAREILRRNRR